jgi:purine-cytosine permease-like protein
VLATAMALRPLGVVRVLARYAVWAALAAVAYLFVEVLREPLPPIEGGGATSFWTAADIVIALPVSWLPLAADYTRHARSARAAGVGSAVGYGLATVVMFVLGVLALAAYGSAGFDVIDALLAVPLGAVAVLVLVAVELDEAFANLYSTAVSAQNVVARLDRRVLALGVGVLATLLALTFDVAAYEPFLFLIGAVFVPLAATLVVDFALSRDRYDTSDRAPARWAMLVPWVAGFVAYQLTAPTVLADWASWEAFWRSGQDALGISPTNGFSASVVALLVAGVLTPVARKVAIVRG